MKVTNMTNSRGNVVKNQFIIDGASFCSSKLRMDNFFPVTGIAFQSYKPVIAFRPSGDKVYLDSHYWDYSKTTGTYRNIFLGETKAETQKKIDSGEYILTNLN